MYFWVAPFASAGKGGVVAASKGMEFAGQYGDSFGVLNALFSGLGFSAIIITLVHQQKQIKIQAEKDNYDIDERRSLFNLKNCEEAYGRAIDLLKDGNNDRATWIQAGRILSHAKALSRGITIENHLRVLEINSLKYRTFFSTLLQSKPAGFFYGRDYEDLTLDEVAKRSTMEKIENGVHYISTDSQLSGESIYEVWEAASWSNEYSDPLNRDFTDTEKDGLLMLYRGLWEFFQHKRTWVSACGELFPRKNKE